MTTTSSTSTLQVLDSVTPAPTIGTTERIEVLAEGLGRYDIDVALPAGYNPDATYPVIVILDGNGLFHTLHGIATCGGSTSQLPPSIVVGVGYPDDEGFASFFARRNYDFTGEWDMADSVGQTLHAFFGVLNQGAAATDVPLRAGGADRFLGFLRDELFPLLAERYAVDESAAHTLVGVSSGGHFLLRAVFDPTSPFRRYVGVSCGFGLAPGAIERLEAEYANAHDDLPVELYLCAGEEEMANGEGAIFRQVSGTGWVREQLALRNYPSCRVRAEIMAGEDHASIVARGINAGLHAVHHVGDLNFTEALASIVE